MCDIFVVKIAKMQQSFWTSIIIKVIVLQEHLVGKRVRRADHVRIK